MSVPPRERKCAQTILRKRLLLASGRLFQSRRPQPSPKPAWLHFPRYRLTSAKDTAAELHDMLSKGRLDLAFASALLRKRHGRVAATARFWFATRTLFSLARRLALRRCCSGGFLVASRCCGRRSDGNAARTTTGPADALLPDHGCHPPLIRTLTLTIGAYAIIT